MTTRDADSGANLLQNYPILNYATLSDSNAVIHGDIHSAPNTSYQVDFFRSVNCDVSGYGEGEFYLGNIFVTTDTGGDSELCRHTRHRRDWRAPHRHRHRPGRQHLGNSRPPCIIGTYGGPTTITVTSDQDERDWNVALGGQPIKLTTRTPARTQSSSPLPAPTSTCCSFRIQLKSRSRSRLMATSQPGSAPNTSSTGNNAALNVVIDGSQAPVDSTGFRPGGLKIMTTGCQIKENSPISTL